MPAPTEHPHQPSRRVSETAGRPVVLCLGELLVDMVPDAGPVEDRARAGRGGLTAKGASVPPRRYVWAVGGAPANAAVAASHLGARAAVVAAVGADPFGEDLRQELFRLGVDAADVTKVTQQTAVAFVTHGPDGERAFLFYPDDPAHDHLTEGAAVAAVDRVLGQRGRHPSDGRRCLHLGSVCLAREPARSASLAALDAAKASGARVSFDLNLRERFWSDLATARALAWEVARRSDMVKLSEEEVAFLAGGEAGGVAGGEAGGTLGGAAGGADDAAERRVTTALLAAGAGVVVVSRGRQGASAFTPEARLDAPAPQVAAVDTTGAGDALTGALLALTGAAPDAWLGQDAASYLRTACAYASLSTARRGAASTYPTQDELDTLLRRG